MFADGKFYLIAQTETDFAVTVLGRNRQGESGVDEDGDGQIEQWSEWQDTGVLLGDIRLRQAGRP